MKLIADSGSTKTDWVLQGQPESISTIGYNPYFTDTPKIVASLTENLLPLIGVKTITDIYFYGSGCSHPSKNKTVEDALKQCFPAATHIEINHDLLGAARALLGQKSGFAAILGTGMNTCLFNGNEVTHNVDSLGFLLGDEGSGSYLGRKLLRDFLRKLMPHDLQVDFAANYPISQEEILDKLYHGERPNRFLASFASFAGKHSQNEYIREMVRAGFQDFFKNVVTNYPSFESHKLNCVGSIGYVFKDLLADVADDFNMPVGNIIQSPVEGLLDFHLGN
ncbi:MAG: N-acetylglucosamine kinase [Flavobacteriaceae bacterium]|nr:N-acetylglucosamine kinase [Flavobacteriaceae bacterium]